PGIAGLDRRGQHVAGAKVTVIFEVLLGVQAAASASAATTTAAAGGALDAGRVLAGAEPGLAGLRPQEIVRVELGAGLRERRRGDDAANLGLLGLLLVAIDRVIVADRAGEHQDVAGLDRKLLGDHGVPS